MNKFIYKRIDERYDPKDSWRFTDSRIEAFGPMITKQYLYFCTHCYSRLWGIWQFYDRPHKSYYDVNIFHYGVPRFTHPAEGSTVAIYHLELQSFKNRRICPVCHKQLNQENLYYFSPACVHNGSYDMDDESVKIVKANQEYTIDQLAPLNPEIDFSTISKHTRTPIVTPGGVASCLCQMSPDARNTIRTQRYDPKDWKSAVEFIDNSFMAFVQSKGVEKVNKHIAECERNEAPKSHYRIETPEHLKQFLKILIGIEKDIYTVSERLKVLYAEELLVDKLAWVDQHRSLRKLAASAKQEEKALQSMRQDDPTEQITIDQIQLSLPPVPIAPQKPLGPILQKAGLFNKKRIRLENAAILEAYRNECVCYEEKVEEYKQALADYNECVAQLKENQKREFEELLEEKRQHQQKLIAQQEDKCKKANIALAEARNENFANSMPKTIAQKSIKNEIHQAEELLQKLCPARREMYNSGVIFHKYHNFVAVSSLYEYLSAGRCASLEGANGAYNLYESEIRLNAIVSQLSQVIEHLQAIERNQFVLYSAITEATAQLGVLNESMKAMNAALDKIDTKLIGLNQKAEVIAYNSEVTAYYSKKNAELTDALCLLTALN